MHQQTLISTAVAVFLAALPGVEAGMYPKSSPVLQLDAKSYDRLIKQSNHTSIVEFYAPWCGHCQNLKPAYEKVAKNLDGLAKVAAVDCDEETNKPFCGSMGVQGFPTLKIVRPGKKAGRPVVEDYQGGRTATAITEAVVAKISNHVQRLTDKELDDFLGKDAEKPKAILFTDKGTTSALLKSVAIDFLDVISVAQIRNKEKAAAEKFSISSWPTLILVPAGGKEPVTYSGEMKKKDIVDFLKQAGEPNPDPAPSKKAAKGKDKPAKEEKEPEKPAEAESETKTAAAAPEATLIDIAAIRDLNDLQDRCLLKRSPTCILALVPKADSEIKKKAIHTLSQLNTKYIHGKRHSLPMYYITDDIDGASTIRESLKLQNKVEIFAVNERRAWTNRYDGDMGTRSVEAWLDAMRMGEGEKAPLPEELANLAGEPKETEKASEAEGATEKEEEKSEHDEL